MIEQIRTAMKNDADEARVRYWQALDVLANPDCTKKKTADALAEAARAGNELGFDAEDIEHDIGLLRTLAELPDTAQAARDAEVESRQLREEAGTLDAEAAGAEARAKALRQEAEAKRGTAARVKSQTQSAARHELEVQRQLADRGYPAALALRMAEIQRNRLAQAEASVEVAARQLAEAEKTLTQARQDPKRNSQWKNYDPIANHVERKRRELDRARQELAELETQSEREVAFAK